MYYCENCRLRFAIPHAARSELREHFGLPCRQTYDVCPRCGCDDFREEGRHGT